MNILVIHGEDEWVFAEPFLEALRARPEVRAVDAPVLPGWHGSERPARIDTVDDLAYELLDRLDAADRPSVVVGLSFGGWVAAEMAVKDQRHIERLVLAAPLGIKVGTRTERDFEDLYAIAPDVARKVLYADSAAVPDLAGADDEVFLRLAVAQDAMARYGWEPYLYDPKLVHRLHRIRVPTTIVAGTADRFVLHPDYNDRYAEAIGDNARVVRLEGVGHRIDEEAPGALIEEIV